MLLAWAVLAAGLVAAQVPDGDNRVLPEDRALAATELVLAFAIFRHGDRTPDHDEVALFPRSDVQHADFFPYGLKTLTNAGKTRGYRVGEFLRRRYDGFLSRLYLADELVLRTTDYDRTKMTALAAMAALYRPARLQLWNPGLAWQPVPYDVVPGDTCELLYWYNCPAYLKLRDALYESDELAPRVNQYSEIYRLFTNYTGTKINNTGDVFYLDNLFQAEQNVGIDPPKWALKHMPIIKEITKLEYEIEFYNDAMKSLAFGVTLGEMLLVAEQAVRGATARPRLYLYSGHENNVAAMMAATGTFYPHQPNYGATYALELRRISATGQYAFVAVYLAETGAEPRLLPISGCGGGVLCPYEQFRQLTARVLLSQEEYTRLCND